jgi:hypothetical protein
MVAPYNIIASDVGTIDATLHTKFKLRLCCDYAKPGDEDKNDFFHRKTFEYRATLTKENFIPLHARIPGGNIVLWIDRKVNKIGSFLTICLPFGKDELSLHDLY